MTIYHGLNDRIDALHKPSHHTALPSLDFSFAPRKYVFLGRAGNLLMSDNFWIDALCLRGEIFYNKANINKIVESLERGFAEFSDISMVHIVSEFFANRALLTKRQYSHLYKYPLRTSVPQTRAR